MGLNHVSQGENEERCIIVSKQVKHDATNFKLSRDSHNNAIQLLAEDKDSKSIFAENDNTKIVSDNNFNEDKAEKDNKQSQTTDANQKIKSSKAKKSNIKQKPSKTKLSIKNDSETQIEDFDALIAAVVKSDKTCCFDKCKKSVAILSQVCKFCNGRFCYSHFIPEAHGCGHLAKLEARSQIRKEGKIHPGSGKPEKKIDPLKQSYLQKKLNEKITSLSTQRKVKTKN